MKIILVTIMLLLSFNVIAKPAQKKPVNHDIQCRIWQKQLKLTTGKQRNKLVDRLWVRCGV
jgi:hypothetical protein